MMIFGRSWYLCATLVALIACAFICTSAEDAPGRKKRGNIYFYWPISDGTACRGGVAAVHYLHHVLLGQGHHSFYFNNVKECFPGKYKSQRLEEWNPTTFSNEDIIIIPEVLTTKYLFTYDPLEAWLPEWQDHSGARVLIWSLAALQTIPPYFLQRVAVDVGVMTHGRAQVLANSAYIRDTHELLGSSLYGGVIRSALSPDFYEAYQGAGNTDSLVLVNSSGKTNLVLIDGDVDTDFLFDPRVRWRQDIVVVKLFGYSPQEVRALYAEARVVVDLYLPGFERVVQEALLFDVVPLLADQYNGPCEDDFTFLRAEGTAASRRRHNSMGLRDRLLFDPGDAQVLADKVDYVLNNYHTLLAHPQLRKFRQEVLEQPNAIPRVVDRWAHTADVTVVMVSCSDTEDTLLLGTILSLLHHYPMVSVEARVRHPDEFVLRHAGLVAMLTRQGLTDRDGGSSFHSVRFRNAAEFYIVGGDVCSTFGGDLAALIQDGGAIEVTASHGQFVVVLPRADLLLGPSILLELVEVFHVISGMWPPMSDYLVPQLVCVELHHSSGGADLGSVCVGQVPRPLTATEHQRFMFGEAGAGFTMVSPDILAVQLELTVSEQCSYLQLGGNEGDIEYCETPDQGTIFAGGVAGLPTELREHPMWRHYMRHSVARLRPSWVFSTASCVCSPLEQWVDHDKSSGSPWRDVLRLLPSGPAVLAAMFDGMKYTADAAGVVAVNPDARFYVIEATDTLPAPATPLTFSYLFPGADADSVGSEDNDSNFSGGAYLSIPARPSTEYAGYPLYNRGVIEPGLTRIWYDILLTRAFQSSPQSRQQIVVDVGGNFGYYSLLGASMNRVAPSYLMGPGAASGQSYKVVSFEPVGNFSAVLRANVAMNGLEDLVHCSDFAVSNHDNQEIDIRVPYVGTLGTARFAGFAFDKFEGANNAVHYPVRATTVTIDTYLTEHYKIAEDENVALLKIDVEGYEFFVVEGARRIIRRYLPHVLMELQPQVTLQLVPAWDEHAGRVLSPQERIATWFNFLRSELKYKVLYFPWESIKYGPDDHGYDWNGELPRGARDFTEVPIEDLLAIKYTVNFWFIPPTIATHFVTV